MLTPQEQSLLTRLLRRAHPTQLQRELIARLQRAAGIPVEPGPAQQRFQELLNQRRLEAARLSELGQPGETTAGLRFSYSRIVEIITRARGRGRAGRYHVIRVDSPVPLVGVGLEEAFRLAIEDFRRLVKYSGPMWWADPLDTGRPAPRGYSSPPELDDYEAAEYFEAPEDVVEDDPYIDN